MEERKRRTQENNMMITAIPKTCTDGYPQLTSSIGRLVIQWPYETYYLVTFSIVTHKTATMKLGHKQKFCN